MAVQEEDNLSSKFKKILLGFELKLMIASIC